MDETNAMVPAFKSHLNNDDSNHLQSREPANPHAVWSDKVSELELVEPTVNEQLRQGNEELAQSEERFRDLFDEAPIITDRVLRESENKRLEAQNAYLPDEIRSQQNFGDIIGGSSGLQVMKQVQRVAPTEATVLITGESGTGKELVARAIHEQSARNGRTLIKLNCSAVPEVSSRASFSAM